MSKMSDEIINCFHIANFNPFYPNGIWSAVLNTYERRDYEALAG